MPREFIPVAAPVLVGNEKRYVMDCLESTWISSRGKYVERFETAFAEFCGVRHGVSCTNGTVALHLALLALGIVPGDEVIVPTLTFVASANAVRYCGATPVFVDCEPETWNMDPDLIEARITPRTKAIIVVHLYGHPVDMDAITSLARRFNLFVVEDAAEAHGAIYKDRMVGSMGHMATFSFFGNKVISTGEGGMIVTNDGGLANTMRQLKDQGMDPSRRYWFPVVGYNYRMTNVTAAIGLAQVEKIEWHIQRRIQVARWYQENLRAVPGLSWQVEQPHTRHVFQFFTILLDADSPVGRDEVIAHLHSRNIEGRPVVFPIHTLPPYRDQARSQSFPVAERIASHGINLPTFAGLNRADVDYVCECLAECLTATQSAGRAIGRSA
jgi:perosamine synthetase